ncbi:DUF2786 domain-containing protein [Nocardioides massiliensis]|uniref:DUF2786 domain-containing protein n=1 Tax=Nocardioides massiliensis TaxID=1325935 RepID=A0ABT9NNV9_9ACTN|nr:DUF2786 domain-containing protein [Nocardioides massiliensis]MDP9822112.1 hypothetical protein [Nocardioides massiliensis]
MLLPRGVPEAGRLAAFNALVRGDRATVCRAAEVPLLDQVDLLWANGWQPDDVLHHTRVALADAKQRRLVPDLVAADRAGRSTQAIDPRWQQQLDDAGLGDAQARRGWLARWSAREGLEGAQLVLAVLAVVETLRVPPLDFLLPPPGRPDQPLASAASAPDRADPVLVRVRRLLAKAESTEFEAEAATYTAKAQELITRHAIDAALLAANRGRNGEAPTMIRVRVDPPYADIKNVLLNVVAAATRCRVVVLGQVSMTAVMGTASDLAAVEALYTSLLVQGQHALAETARSAPPGARTRSASYRSAFWLAYADRLGERLREVTDHVVAGSTDSDRLLPALQSQADALDAWVTERFGTLGTSPVRGGWDAAGWTQGRLAGDTAKLATGDLRPTRRAIG